MKYVKILILIACTTFFLSSCYNDNTLSSGGGFENGCINCDATLSSQSGGENYGTTGGATGQSGSITRFAVHNGFMYALNPNEIVTYDLSNADEPKKVNALQTDYGLETIFIYENTIYLGSRNALYILGLENPKQPNILSQTTRDEIFIGGCDPVVVQGNYAYSTVKIIENICGWTNSFSALIVYDVTDKENPIEVGTYPLNVPNGLGIKGNRLFVCDEGSDQITIFDISDPTNLQMLWDESITADNPFDVIVSGNTMIVSMQTQFEIFDVSDLNNIVPVGVITR